MPTYKDDIETYVKANTGLFTRQQVADHFNKPYDRVRKLATERSLSGFFSGGIIVKERTLTQEANMRDATKTEQTRIERLLEKNGYRPRWGVAWVHLQDDGIKTTTLLRNPQEVEQDTNDQEEFLRRIARKAPKVKARELSSENLLILANMDVHIGKSCELVRTNNTYTVDEAVRRVLEGQATLYKRTLSHGITDVLIPLGNDIIHVDNNRASTPSGTPQDVNASAETMMYNAVEMYIRLVESMAKKHNVWLCHVHSNHDRLNGWSVSQMVYRYFQNDPRVHMAVESMNNTPRKYFIYGHNLIMFQHGESKDEAIVGQMMNEARLAVSQTLVSYVYQGDKHHKMTQTRGETVQRFTEKDYNGVTVIKSANGNARNRVKVETVRSPSEADAWHTTQNYNNLPAVECFIHDTNSQWGRFTHWF